MQRGVGGVGVGQGLRGTSCGLAWSSWEEGARRVFVRWTTPFKLISCRLIQYPAVNNEQCCLYLTNSIDYRWHLRSAKKGGCWHCCASLQRCRAACIHPTFATSQAAFHTERRYTEILPSAFHPLYTRVRRWHLPLAKKGDC